ncbi:MAG: diguanylate cyclase domain-containing protein [Janthinobacterium lividum]
MKYTNDAELLPRLEEHIRRFEAGRFGPLWFPPELEACYLADTVAARSRMLLMQGMLGLLAYDFFIVGDYLLAPAHIVRSAVIRFGMMTPLVFLVALLLRGRRNTVLLEFSAACLCIVGAVSTLYMRFQVSVGEQIGLIVILLIANCMLRIEVPFAFAITFITLLLDIAVLHVQPGLAPAAKLYAGGIMAWIALLTLTANYTMMRERRYSYLLQLRGRLQRGLLAGINAELLALSSTDRLTGLPNRRAYDERLLELWRVAQDRKEPISAVMVDVDFFKRLNDTHGHPYGDKVLQRVASLLQQALRAEGDFVARFGGEEFIVLLPETEPDAAYRVAERMRTLVQVAGSPAMQKDSPFLPSDLWTTVSCGVSTAWPSGQSDPHRLIVDADAALYRAKKEGRNRCCCAPQPPSAKVTMFPKALRS